MSANVGGPFTPAGLQPKVVSERSSMYQVPTEPTTTPAGMAYGGAVQQAPPMVSYATAPCIATPAASVAAPVATYSAHQQPSVMYAGSAYAGPVAYAVSQTYAAPPQQQQYVLPGGSYVPPPVMHQQQNVGPVAPQPPQNLTAGMPDPSAIATQKAAYSKSLEEQKNHGEDMLKQQKQQQTEYIYQAAEAQKQQIIAQIDQQAKQQESQLSQKYSQQVMSLQQEYQQQTLVLEKQANDLTMEFQKRKTQEEMMTQQYEIQRSHYDDQLRIFQEMQQHQQGARQQMPPGVALGPVAVGVATIPQTQMVAGGSYVPPPVPMNVMTSGSNVMPGGSYVPPPQTVMHGTMMPQQPHATQFGGGDPGMQLVGTWQYGQGDTYQLTSGGPGVLRFDERHPHGEHASGTLMLDGQGWFTGELKFDRGEVLGVVRLRAAPDRLGALISNFKGPGEPNWDEDTIAQKVGGPSGTQFVAGAVPAPYGSTASTLPAVQMMHGAQVGTYAQQPMPMAAGGSYVPPPMPVQYGAPPTTHYAALVASVPATVYTAAPQPMYAAAAQAATYAGCQ